MKLIYPIKFKMNKETIYSGIEYVFGSATGSMWTTHQIKIGNKSVPALMGNKPVLGSIIERCPSKKTFLKGTDHPLYELLYKNENT
jgi:hypothetical protein